MQSNNMSSQEHDNLAGQVMESLGEPKEAAEEIKEINGSDINQKSDDKDDLPIAAKERLGRQEKRHKKELRALQEQIQSLHARMGSPNHSITSQQNDPYANAVNPPGNVEDQIHKAVNIALNAKDAKEREMAEAVKREHIYKLHQDLDNKLDKASDKYDDFDDVVRGKDVPFTQAMREAALVMPYDNADDVFYHLGKNRNELERVSRLHPVDQAREMTKLSVALKGGHDKKSATSSNPVMGSIKSNPVTSSSVNEKTPVSDLRQRLKAGWK